MEPIKFLLMTVGLPRSGKSTWAREQNIPMVNPDAVRMGLYAQAYLPEAEDMVWTITRYMIRSLFIAGHDRVILDATSTTEELRRKWRSSRWVRQFVFFDQYPEQCIERATRSGREDLIPVIQKMSVEFEAPSIDEYDEREYAIVGKIHHPEGC
jgi:predicted kinase